MSTWFSEYRVRSLAERIAPRIAPKVEAALLACIRAELPGMLMEELRNEIPDYTPKLKNSVALRRDRDNLIRARYTGHNSIELAHQFGLSVRHIRNIVGVGKPSP
jgi:hypothetical protein